jgi:microcystin-dependent protein
VSEPFLGQILPVAFNYPPHGWALCDGQVLPINQNQALFSLLGTTYGGNGQTTFALPNLRGRISIHDGQGPGLPPHSLGEQAGAETVTLTANELPSHTHGVQGATAASSTSPAGTVFATGGAYGAPTATPMHASTIQAAGGGQAHDNMPPFLVIAWCICLVGIFPSFS